jgi:hypothetical protein
MSVMPGRSLPLIARVSLALALVAILPLGYTVWSLFDVNRDGMQQQVLRTHAVAASTASERIATSVETRRAFARSLALNPAITGDPHSDVARGLMREILGADASIAMIEIVTPWNEPVIRAQRRELAERAGPLPQSMLPQLWRRNGAHWLLVTEPFAASGSLRLLADVSSVGEALDPAEIGGEAEMVLAAPDKVLAGIGTLSSFPKPMIEAAASARVNGTGVYRDTRGAEIIGAFAPVPGTNWYVLSRQPFERANEIAGAMRRRAAVAAAVGLVLAGIIVLVAYRTVIRPIREVVQAQQKLAGTIVVGGNEIDQLRSSAEKLGRRLADQEDISRIFLGRYQVLGIIGQGGMGTVFRGWDPKLRRSVALKTIRYDSVAPQETHDLVDTLVKEAITAASVNHPNIVSVYDVEDTPNAAFIAMELVDGPSLQAFLDRDGSLSPAQTVLVGLAVAKALEAAHSRGLQHHDIKPANVLLGRDGAIKVTDFGLAALIQNTARADEMVFGTPGFLAPEVAMASARDTRSDLFSLGVTLYVCATGVSPFEKKISHETLVATVIHTPPAIEERVHGEPELVRPLSRLVAMLMAKKPEERPATAGEVAGALDLLVRHHDLSWHIETVPEMLPKIGHGSAALIPTISLERVTR